MTRKIEMTDVFIKPDITSFCVMSFEKGAEIIAAGESAARSKMDELRAIAALQKDTIIPKNAIPVAEYLFITDVRIEGNTSYPSEYILGKLKLKFPTTVSFRDLNIWDQ